jgi:hypothetical protein
MKQHNQKQLAGVCLDNAKAIIIASSSENGSGSYSIKERVYAPGVHAGGSEHSRNNARQSDLLKYYKSLSDHLRGYDEVLVFGPGMAQEQFGNHVEGDAQFKGKKITIASTEQLTDPQMIAKVRDFFSPHQA